MYFGTTRAVVAFFASRALAGFTFSTLGTGVTSYAISNTGREQVVAVSTSCARVSISFVIRTVVAERAGRVSEVSSASLTVVTGWALLTTFGFSCGSLHGAECSLGAFGFNA